MDSRASGLSSAPKPHDVIVGSREPQLFFPFELFERALTLAYADDAKTREAYREAKEYQRKALGLPSDLWERLDAISTVYRADRRREREIALSTDPNLNRSAELQLVDKAICRDRFAALNEARAEFGPAFIRFLYVAVAPETTTVVFRRPDAKVLTFVNGGCND